MPSLMGQTTFYENNYSYVITGTNTVEIKGYNTNKEQAIIIPSSVNYNGKTYYVTSIGRDVFRHNDVSKIVIPEGVTQIGNFAFAYCSKLVEIILPESLESIGSNAFSRNPSLVNVNLPSNISSIDDRAFYYCPNLKSVTFPEKTLLIGIGVFGECNNLSLPENFLFTVWSSVLKKNNPQIFKSFLEYYNDSEYAVEAQKHIDVFEENKAIVELDYPKTVQKKGSIYEWTTVFRETGGKSGYWLNSNNLRIIRSNGSWTHEYDKKVVVNKNGSTEIYYYTTLDGTFYLTWAGYDDYGNLIIIEQKVILEK